MWAFLTLSIRRFWNNPWKKNETQLTPVYVSWIPMVQWEGFKQIYGRGSIQSFCLFTWIFQILWRAKVCLLSSMSALRKGVCHRINKFSENCWHIACWISFQPQIYRLSPLPPNVFPCLFECTLIRKSSGIAPHSLVVVRVLYLYNLLSGNILLSDSIFSAQI